jgi:hypothetical protein
MNPTTKTGSTAPILAIDLAKYKSVVCVHDRASGEFRFATFDTKRTEMHRLLTGDLSVHLLAPSPLTAEVLRQDPVQRVHEQVGVSF